MLLLLLLFCVLSIVSVFCSDCEFSKNCYKTKECKTIQVKYFANYYAITPSTFTLEASAFHF